jgi:hypothetical protein
MNREAKGTTDSGLQPCRERKAKGDAGTRAPEPASVSGSTGAAYLPAQQKKMKKTREVAH